MQDESLNKILKEMWRLDEKNSLGGELHEDEKSFWNAHLHIIKEYYAKNQSYWGSKTQLS